MSNLKSITQILKPIRSFVTLRMTWGILLCALTFALLASPVFAACDATESAKPVNERVGCPAGLDQIEGMIANIISVIVGLGFVSMLVLLVWAGIKYLTSGGEPKAIQAAHQTATWALLGILFMALAWLILQLVAGFTGIDVTVFNIKTLCGDPKAPIPFPFCSPSPKP